MKRLVWLIAVFAIVGMVNSCGKTMKRQINISYDTQKEVCEDPDCTICGGEGTYTCDNCDGVGDFYCNVCSGTGMVDCGGLSLLGGDCRNGSLYIKDSTSGEYEYEGVCEMCDGTGMVEHIVCNGTGRKPCLQCDADGIKSHSVSVTYSDCRNCYAYVEGEFDICPECGMAEYIYECNSCPAEFNEYYDVCPECGAGAEEGTEETEDSTATEDTATEEATTE